MKGLKMKTITMSIFAAIGLFVLTMFQPAQASTTLMTINCDTAVHLADFKSCAVIAGIFHGSGVYTAFSPSHFAIVKISASGYATYPTPHITCGES
jgi:hypothetical protein